MLISSFIIIHNIFHHQTGSYKDISKATLDGLLADKAALSKVLTYHVVSGKVISRRSLFRPEML